jgi:hypothetical protein
LLFFSFLFFCFVQVGWELLCANIWSFEAGRNMTFPHSLLTLSLSFSLLVSPVHSAGEEAVIVYSRDDSCRGQEMIRAFTPECKEFYSNDDATMDYFKFHCNEDTNTLTMEEYLDKDCLKSTGNVTVLMESTTGTPTATGSCQRYSHEQEERTNYHSAQLFCGGISSIQNPKTFFSAFETEKIMFRHYTNADDTCSDKPSVIELVILPLYFFPPSH